MPDDGRERRLWMAAMVAALSWHALWVAAAWRDVRAASGASDFTSFYYAARVAHAGGDPYDTDALRRLRQDDVAPLPRRRPAPRRPPHGGVYPFLYPPPFLVAMRWATGKELLAAFRAWFWIDEASLAVAVLALWAWLRRAWGARAGFALVIAACVGAPFINNRYMGQVNTVLLALVALGLWQVEAGRAGGRLGGARQLAGGALVGLGCVLKISPVLFVLWWLLRRELRPVIGAAIAALVAFAVSAALFGWLPLERFFVAVLPSLASGHYNALEVPVTFWANSSPASLVHRFTQGWAERWVAAGLSLVLSAGVLGALTWRKADDPERRAAALGALGVLVLMVPSYTFEHHMVWALPAVAVSAAALAGGRLGRGWALAVGLSWAGWGFDQGAIERVAAAEWTGRLATLLLREIKLAALCVLLAATLRVALAAGTPAATAAARPR